MIEFLTKSIDRWVLPKYPVLYTYEIDFFYNVHTFNFLYTIKFRIEIELLKDDKELDDIIREIQNIYKMLGGEESYEVRVLFYKKK